MYEMTYLPSLFPKFTFRKLLDSRLEVVDNKVKVAAPSMDTYWKSWFLLVVPVSLYSVSTNSTTEPVMDSKRIRITSYVSTPAPAVTPTGMVSFHPSRLTTSQEEPSSSLRNTRTLASSASSKM